MSTFSYEIDFKQQKNEKASIQFSEINGDTLFSHNAKEGITPASVLKLFSMNYALDSLGANFVFKTKVLHTGEIKNGILNGDLYLVGDGDPYLNHPQLINLAVSIKRSGISQINGNLYYDNSLFPEQSSLSQIGLGDQTYNPSVGPLNSEFNRASLWSSTRPPKSIIPELSILVTETKSGFMPTQKFRKDQSKKESWWMKKGSKLSIREDLPIRNAGQWTANLFKYHLGNFGVRVKVTSYKKTPKDAKIIAVEESLPLWNFVSLTMEYSNNLLAEAIALRACYKNKVSPLSIETCAKEISKSISLSKAPKFVNSSGLSIESEISAQAATSFLQENFSKSWKNHTFLSLLSYSGQSGWMRNRLASPNYNMRVYAKTGSLDFVNNIAGYIRAKSGKWYSFSIFHTDEFRRKALNKLNPTNYKSLKGQAKSWRKSSLDKADKLLKDFIDNN